ncbi:MAG: hypothetical protein ACK5Y2_09165 [Bdellovibrionales bacterium]
MKKLLLITAVTIASVSAHASRARLNALQNAQHLDDIQRIYIDQPERMVNYEAATLEFGGNAGANPSAEGGFIRRMGDSAFTMYLGRPSQTFGDFVSGFTGNFTGATAPLGANLAAGHTQQNSLLLGYGSKMGDISWGATVLHIGNDFRGTQTFGNLTGTETLGYSVSRIEQSITGVHLGATNGVWDVQLRQGLGAAIKSTISGVGAQFGGATGLAANDVLNVEATQSTRLRAGYKMDTMYVYGNYAMGAGEIKTPDGKLVDLENSEVRLGVVNSNKKDGVEFFYGAEVVSTTADNDGSVAAGKTETTNVPVFVGIEAEATSWMVLRGGLSQSINLLSSTKRTGTSESDIADNTTTSLGAGFKWGKAMIDAVVSTGNTGNFGSNGANGDILGQASLTYFF